MTTDLYATELWLDGQEVETDKLNNGQRFLRAQLTDQILETLIGSVVPTTGLDPSFGGQNGANASTARAYALCEGAAYLRQGSANNKIQIAPGTLLQKIANADGSDSTLVAYKFAGSEEWTLTAGDGTNPRVDLLQMALSYTTDTPLNVDFQDAITRANTTVAGTATKRRLLCTLSVKQGTPGASPVVPEPDAGAVAVGSVLVGNSWATGGNAPIMGIDTTAVNNAVVHDQRIPLGVRTYVADPSTYKLVTAWSTSNAVSTVTSTNATNVLIIPCPVTIGRLVGIGISHDAGSTMASMLLGQTSGTNLSGTFASRISVPQLSSGADADDILPFWAFENTQSPAAGPTVVHSTTTKVGVPIWCNGRRMPFEKNRINQAIPAAVPTDRLMLKIASGQNGTVIGAVTFYIAEGL